MMHCAPFCARKDHLGMGRMRLMLSSSKGHPSQRLERTESQTERPRRAIVRSAERGRARAWAWFNESGPYRHRVVYASAFSEHRRHDDDTAVCEASRADKDTVVSMHGEGGVDLGPRSFHRVRASPGVEVSAVRPHSMFHRRAHSRPYFVTSGLQRGRGGLPWNWGRLLPASLTASLRHGHCALPRLLRWLRPGRRRSEVRSRARLSAFLG